MRVYITVLWVTVAISTGVLITYSANAFEVTSISVGTVLSKTDPPDYGNYGYRYAPTLIRRADSSVDCWFCGGIATRTNPDDGRDHVLFTRDWTTPEVALCAKNEDSRVTNPLCEWLYRDPPGVTPTDDHFGICDPTVIKVAGQYWMYYTAEPDGGGDDGQMFLARSIDGRSWVKYPNNSVPAQAILPFPDPALAWAQRGKYGIGEGSALFKDNEFWLYYTYHPYNGGEGNSVYLTRSTDGITFGRGERLFAESTIPYLGNGGNGGLDVKYIPGWDVFLAVTPTQNKQNLTWNVSRDGTHWLPWSSSSFGSQTRQIPLPRRYAISPAMEGNEHGHIGDGTLASHQSTRIVFAAGDGEQSIDDFWLWTLDAVDIVVTPQPLNGSLESVDGNKIASGWAYDPDTGTNDSAANGGPSGPLGHDTWVRAVGVDIATGLRYEGPWQSAAVPRPDLVVNSAAPDPYHGFLIDLKAQDVPAGTYVIHVEGGEFPVGMGATTLTGAETVTIEAACHEPTITSQPTSLAISAGSVGQLSVSANGTTPVTYRWYGGGSGDTSKPISGNTATISVNPTVSDLFWSSVSNACGEAWSGTTIVHVLGSEAGARAVRVRPRAPSWRMVGIADFDRDTHDDILLQSTSGALAVWSMYQTGAVSTDNMLKTQPVSSQWRVVGTGDFNTDGWPDIVLQNGTTREIYVE